MFNWLFDREAVTNGKVAETVSIDIVTGSELTNDLLIDYANQVKRMKAQLQNLADRLNGSASRKRGRSKQVIPISRERSLPINKQ